MFLGARPNGAQNQGDAKHQSGYEDTLLMFLEGPAEPCPPSSKRKSGHDRFLPKGWKVRILYVLFYI
jgi:hypothetical protein